MIDRYYTKYIINNKVYIIRTETIDNKMFVYINNIYVRTITFNTAEHFINNQKFHERLRYLILNKYNIINEDVNDRSNYLNYLIIKHE